MASKSPGAKAKGLGAELRVLRQRAGMTLEDAAKPVDLSKTILSKLETGHRNIAFPEAIGLLALYGVVGEERDRVLTLARSVDEPGWWEVGIPGMTKESATLADYETIANGLTDWAPLLIPGLLHTMDYARAIFGMYDLAPHVLEARLNARLRRQQTMWRPEVTYTAYLGESALRSVVGDATIMAAQLHALLDAQRRSNIAIRIVPQNLGPYLGQLGAFLKLDFRPAETVVHVELLHSGVFHDEPRLTDPYVKAVAQLAEVALSATESTRMIDAIAHEMEGQA
ncbi:MAG TPA: helix-turn-helix transcriptional regulator [Pseudonocardiaceae bacterium]|jgi:transcriptional regulator with XRE-family HTH domain|nr:helix-turn-helix transcriptional regulator [Pseudonocardiaceae bacterium]